MRWIRQRRRAAEVWLGPVASGVVEGISSVAGLTGALAVIALSLDLANPSQEVFRDLTQAEVGLFIAFSVATAGAGLRSGEKLADHLKWLGLSCGVGVAALLGIVFSIALAAYREAGHASVLDIVGFSWIAASTLMLGLLVALLPYAVFVWRQPIESSPPSGDAQ